MIKKVNERSVDVYHYFFFENWECCWCLMLIFFIAYHLFRVSSEKLIRRIKQKTVNFFRHWNQQAIRRCRWESKPWTKRLLRPSYRRLKIKNVLWNWMRLEHSGNDVVNENENKNDKNGRKKKNILRPCFKWNCLFGIGKRKSNQWWWQQRSISLWSMVLDNNVDKCLLYSVAKF